MTTNSKRSNLFRRLWWLWFFVVPFCLVDLWLGLRFYFHEANHSNEGLDVLLGSLSFGLYFAVPAGLCGLAIAGLIYYVREMRRSQS